MAHWEQAPDPRLARFVEAYAFSNDDDAPDPPRPIRVVPDGCTDLLVSVGGEAGARVFGTKTRALWVAPGPPVENVLVRFRPGAGTRFLRTCAAALTDAAVDLAALWGDEGRRLLDAVVRARTPRGRAAIVERALLSRLDDGARTSPLDAATDAAVTLIRRSRGRVRVCEIARRVGLHERRLERGFRDRVGVSPKRLARILRFRAAHAELARGVTGVEVAHAAGYCDQAHLLRDFRELAGAPPSRVLPAAPTGVSDSSNSAR